MTFYKLYCAMLERLDAAIQKNVNTKPMHKLINRAHITQSCKAVILGYASMRAPIEEVLTN